MAIVISGDLDWTGALILFLEALDGGPAADVAGYAFTSSGDLEYSCSVPEPVLPADRLLGTYRCVAETAGGVIAGVGYCTIAAATTAVRLRSEEASLDPVLDAIDAYLASITAAAQDTPGTIAGFPATLSVGDSYTDEMNNAITVTLVDDQGDPVDTWGDYDVNHAGFTPTLAISGSGGKVTATVTYDTDHFLVEIPSSESLRASPGTATMQFVLKWYVADRLVAQKTIVTGQAVTWIKQI